MLVNVNLLDKERAEKNVELRKKKPDYLPYVEDESVDDLAQAGRQHGHRAAGGGLGGGGGSVAFQEPDCIPTCPACLAA